MKIINETIFQPATVMGRLGFPEHSLTLVLKGTFDLVPDDKVKPVKKQAFPTGEESYPDDEEGLGSSRYESDFAPFKPRADLLLVGSCHCPDNKPAQTCPVTFQVGNRSKSLVAFGNRYRKGLLNNISDPESFSELELRYEKSFGGNGYQKNPVGVGYKNKSAEDRSSLWPLPNIEDPKSLIHSSDDEPEPAGFGPLGKMWQDRNAKVGTYEEKWLKERWPWFPQDFDWDHFNAAPPSMQVEGYLNGDENLYLKNLHPVHSEYHSRLPGLRIRCFLNELQPKGQSTEQPVFREVPMNLDTLWVDMDAEKLTLVWRGPTKVLSDELEEIEHLFIVSEKLEEQARSLQYYADQLKEMLAEEQAEREYIVKPRKPIPAEDFAETDAEISRAEKQMRATLVESGIDPDNPPMPSEEEQEKEAKILQELGFEAEIEISPLTRERVQERITRGEGFANDDLRGIDLSGLKMSGVDFNEAILTGVCLRQSDLSAANLTGANLEETDFSGAILRGASLTEADFSRADLSQADLSDALMVDTIFEKASLINAVLNRVSAKDANFTGANLSGASLEEAHLQGCVFSKSTLNGTNFQSAHLREASVEGASGIRVDMTNADLAKLRASGECNFSQGIFRGVSGPESTWGNANLCEADFSYSKMEGADFSDANLESANLVAADLKFSKFTKANLTKAKCIQMNLFQGSFEKADLTLADVSGSNLYEVEFLNAIVSETDFSSANMKMTKLAVVDQ